MKNVSSIIQIQDFEKRTLSNIFMPKDKTENRVIANYPENRSLDILLTSEGLMNGRKKTRNKPIKSCRFCRQKKLRCDQKRPCCTTCVQKNQEFCTYSDIRTMKEKKHSDSAAELSDRVSSLEQRLCQIESKEKTVTSRVGNVLLGLNFYQIKENVRRTMFGPTSPRTFFLNERWGLYKTYYEIQNEISERNKCKNTAGQPILYEHELTELLSGTVPEFKQKFTLLDEILGSLPSYESTSRKIDLFFENSKLFIINEVFDKVKVVKDFRECFVPGPASSQGNGRPIESLVTSGRNYYKIGVILGIVMYVELSYQIPQSFETFFVLLHGMGLSKMNCIERIQVTFLRYSFRAKWSLIGSDALHSIELVNSMVNDVFIVGLNTKIDVTFTEQKIQCGSVPTLRKLWLWILFYDVDSALQMGSMLKVPDELIFDDTIFEMDSENSGSLDNVMGLFLKMSRPMLLSIFNKTQSPDLQANCEKITQFIEDKFPVNGSYMDELSVETIPFHNTIILSLALSLLLAFYGLRVLALKEKNDHLRNSLGKSIIISFALSVNLILRNHKMDKVMFPTTLKSSFKCLSPYMCLAVSFLNRLIVRALSIFYTILFHKLTSFKNGLSTLSLKNRKGPVDITTIRVSSVDKLSIISVFDNLSEIFDRFKEEHYEVFNLIIHRSTTFLKVFLLEGVCRKYMDGILKSGKVTEKAEILYYQHKMDTTLASTRLTTSVHSLAGTESDCFSLGANEWETIAGLSPDTRGIVEKDPMLSYDNSWEELLGGLDDIELYYDLIDKQ
ncbi:uncharacterized protein ZBIST_5050 [Zygosaccharomyces bailii]|nr:uncharacterized protein ZBIST_5050 [Zygosaccharomyces bailii]